MNKIIKSIYSLITFIFIILTIIEFFIYLNGSSNSYGLIYLIMNFICLFFLSSVTINYSTRNRKVRLSKNIICIIIGVFASFILGLILSNIFGYVDNSKEFISSVFLISKVLKPILYLLIMGVSGYEIYLVYKH